MQHVVLSPDARPHTFLCGLLGAGIGASRSPELHEREGAALGLALVYRLLDAEVMGYGAADLPGLLAMLGQMGFAGVNVTHPFKQAAAELMDELSDAARALGAVNTVVWREGRLFGDNTDWSGYRAHFAAALGDRPHGRVALIGAGGAAAAVGYAHLDLGAEELRIFDTSAERAAALAARLGALFPAAAVRAVASAAEAITGADGVAQTSPVGMQGHAGLPFDPALLAPAMWVSDIIYFPAETALLAAARARGCATLNGAGMVVRQAADALARFTGHQPDTARMLAAFHQHTP
ncbi:MAG TPA: shikimate dehydrogenase [Novosphingobium sp.]|nr:shikimate dehydrogenase [Novosphingobium sp.]HZV09089.1 shikimate dehydrogenase [Novosphingobium sp.]